MQIFFSNLLMLFVLMNYWTACITIHMMTLVNQAWDLVKRTDHFWAMGHLPNDIYREQCCSVSSLNYSCFQYVKMSLQVHRNWCCLVCCSRSSQECILSQRTRDCRAVLIFQAFIFLPFIFSMTSAVPNGWLSAYGKQKQKHEWTV